MTITRKEMSKFYGRIYTIRDEMKSTVSGFSNNFTVGADQFNFVPRNLTLNIYPLLPKFSSDTVEPPPDAREGKRK